MALIGLDWGRGFCNTSRMSRIANETGERESYLILYTLTQGCQTPALVGCGIFWFLCQLKLSIYFVGLFMCSVGQMSFFSKSVTVDNLKKTTHTLHSRPGEKRCIGGPIHHK